MIQKRTAIAITMALILSACGSDDDSRSPTSNTPPVVTPPVVEPPVVTPPVVDPPVITPPVVVDPPVVTPAPQVGVFVDAPVAGLAYRIGSADIKYTNANGEFEYQPGDLVVFSIGGIELPPVAATGLVTPLTVFETNDVNDTEVVNFARLLQTLDSDGNPDNGITIAEVAHQSAASLTVDFANTTAFESAVTNLIANGGGSATTLVSAEAAIEHLQEQLAEHGVSLLVGTWYLREAESNTLITITFLDDGRYLLVEDGEADVGETSGGPGVEYGTYEWNATSGVLTAHVTNLGEGTLTDTNGDWGLSHPLGTMTLVVSGDTATFRETDDEDDGDEGNAVFHRLNKDETSALVGTWQVPSDLCECSLALAIFIDDEDGQAYVMAEISDTDDSGRSGYEVGSYEWDAQTGELALHVTADTNGEWGLAGDATDPVIPSALVDGDNLTIDLDDEDPLVFPRLP